MGPLCISVYIVSRGADCLVINYPFKNVYTVKSLQAINAGEDVEKREPSYTVGGNAN